MLKKLTCPIVHGVQVGFEGPAGGALDHLVVVRVPIQADVFSLDLKLVGLGLQGQELSFEPLLFEAVGQLPTQLAADLQKRVLSR